MGGTQGTPSNHLGHGIPPDNQGTRAPGPSDWCGCPAQLGDPLRAGFLASRTKFVKCRVGTRQPNAPSRLLSSSPLRTPPLRLAADPPRSSPPLRLPPILLAADPPRRRSASPPIRLAADPPRRLAADPPRRRSSPPSCCCLPRCRSRPRCRSPPRLRSPSRRRSALSALVSASPPLLLTPPRRRSSSHSRRRSSSPPR